MFYEMYVKRSLDIFFAGLGGLLLWPIALLCALAIKLDDPQGTVFFKQKRNGRNGEVFEILKFRTMKSQLSGGLVLAEQETLTPVGKIIRKLSLDEIPQFFNILRGEMSLIGPRPLPFQYYSWYNSKELRRFEVRPGLTGFAQINGSLSSIWEERFCFDMEYVDRLSFGLDVQIFFRTFFILFSRKKIRMNHSNLMPNFADYRKKQLEAKKELEQVEAL